MPHLTVEHSANLDGRADIGALCARLAEALLATGLFETGAVRVRAVAATRYAIADQHPANAFADLSLRIGAGRSAADKKAVGDALFAVAADFFAPLFETPYFALSLEIREIDPGLSWKKNAIHPRLRALPTSGTPLRS